MPEYTQQGGTRTSKLFMQDQWQPGLFYHVIGKAVPGEVLFREEADMIRFARQILRFKLYHCFEILVYCMCVNHFHLVIRTRSAEGIRASLKGKPVDKRNPSDVRMLAFDIAYTEFVANTLSGATSAYARWYNHKYGREGKLFVQPTLHGLTTKGAPGKELSRSLCAYVGLNFVKHDIAPAGTKYTGSSLTHPRFGIVLQETLLALFGGEEAYLAFHRDYLRTRWRPFIDFDEEDFYAALHPRYFDKATGRWVEGEWRPGLA